MNLSIFSFFMFCLSLLHPSIDMREIGFKNDLSRFYDILSDPSITGRRLGLRMTSLGSVLSLLIEA